MCDRTILLVTFAWLATACVLASPKERSLPNAEAEELERGMMEKRAGARAFAPRMLDFDSYLYPTSKRFGGLSPYYFYRPPKRGGGRSFANYWSPPVATGSKRFGGLSPYYFYRPPKRGGGRSFANYWSPPVATGRFYEDSPFFKKRSPYSSDDYLF